MTDPTPAEVFDERMGIVNMPDKNDMEAQQARADAILANFAAGVNAATSLPAIETPGYVIVPGVDKGAIDFGVPINLPPGWSDAPPVKVATTAELVESAEILKRALVEAENAFEAEMKPMRDKLKEAEDALRAKALAAGETIKGAHIQVQIVAPSVSVKWDDKGLTGAVAMLPDNWKAAILAHRKTDEKPATTRVVYK